MLIQSPLQSRGSLAFFPQSRAIRCALGRLVRLSRMATQLSCKRREAWPAHEDRWSRRTRLTITTKHKGASQGGAVHWLESLLHPRFSWSRHAMSLAAASTHSSQNFACWGTSSYESSAPGSHESVSSSVANQPVRYNSAALILRLCAVDVARLSSSHQLQTIEDPILFTS